MTKSILLLQSAPTLGNRRLPRLLGCALEADHNLPPEARLLYLEGLRLRAEGELVLSANHLTRAAEAARNDPNSMEAAEIKLALGITLVDLKRYEAAAEALRGVLTVFEAFDDTLRLGDAFNTLGNALYGGRNLSEAAAAYGQAENAYRKGHHSELLPVRWTRSLKLTLCSARLHRAEIAIMAGLVHQIDGTLTDGNTLATRRNK